MWYLLFLIIVILSASQQSLVLSSSPSPKSPHRCLSHQRSALVQLQQDVLKHYNPSVIFDDNSSMKVQQWKLERDCCSWEGVTCDVAGYVTGLNLNYSMISGHISAIFDLHHLQYLSLASNNFRLNPIPSGFDRLKSLTHLNLSYSCFSDQIPMEISRLTRLISLDLSTIPFCELPNTFNDPDFNRIFEYEELHRLRLEEPNLQTFFQNLNALRELKLDYVDLSAQGSNWSDALAHALPNLQVLSLSFCRLSGPIHPSFSQLKSLSHIGLDGNHLSSAVPHFLADFSNLVTLSLRSCGLHGSFPEKLFTLPKLQTIDLSDNSLLTGQLPNFSLNNSFQQMILYKTNFHGKLPDSIGNLKFLTTLLLYNCNFTGWIPSSLANLTQVLELDLSYNRFSGPIPPFHSSTVPKLVDLGLSYNLLDGAIDSLLFTLPSLQNLRMNNNHFTGQLEEIPNASSSVLEYVYLQGNGLSGPIPRSISKLPRLFFLSLAANNFNGSMKLDIFQSLQNLTSLDLSDNNLAIESDDNEGFTFPSLEELRLSSCNLNKIPKFLKNEVVLRSLNLSNNHIHGSVPSWLLNSSTLYELDLSHNEVDFSDSNQGKSVFSGDEFTSFAVLGKLAMRSCNVSRFPDFLKAQDGLFYLDLSGNKIDGRTPSWIWKKKLQYLNISHNFLYALDEFLPNMSTPLQTLDLRANLLQGSLPKAICNLSSLSIFDASDNKLSGLIPECLGKIGTLSVLNVKGNNYRRFPPDFGLASSLRSLNINGNQLEGELPRSLAKCTMLEVWTLVTTTFPIHFRFGWINCLN
ncbi:unnamed protein product [Ilex paraguariensis]|uniref:Leucine-rich repeat-containing N-terminal plant-type domain-containing protein n=1 Tax=Ilex paraguariensis TaxID=185542 RepID=A0ABC8SFF7_9AQUA